MRGTRRGSALILVLLMTLAVAALAVAAIFMSSSAGLLSRFYDRERQFSYAAESALEQAISKLQLDTSFAVTSTTPVSVIPLTDLYDASGAAISGAKVQVWGALTGDTTSSGPITVTLLAQVSDVVGTRFVRRVDLRREHLASYQYFSNGATTSSSLPFESGSKIAGRIHANGDWAAIGGNPTYRDSITSAGTVGGSNANQFLSGRASSVRRIPWPATDSVLGIDSIAAAANGLVILTVSGNPARVEFVWVDVDADGIADRDEGYARVFDLSYGDADVIDLNPDNDDYYEWDDPIIQNQCGAFYFRNGSWQFFPVATHRAAWAWSIISGAGEPAAPSPSNWSNTGHNRRDATRAILTRPTARCFPAGSPYLVNTERFTDAAGNVGTTASHDRPFGAISPAHQYGGSETTITQDVRTCQIDWNGTLCSSATTAVGSWRTLSAETGRETLAPLDRNGTGAVVFADDDVRVSGVVAGRVTLSVRGDAYLIDRITHASGPNHDESDCDHIFGLVAQDRVRIRDNAVSRRRRVGSGTNTSGGGANASLVALGGAQNFVLHGAYLSLEGSFGIDGNDEMMGNQSLQFSCAGSQYSAGCIAHSGSAAMMTPREFSSGNGEGARYTPTADACFERGYRPPFWPATNRYTVIRALDVRTSNVIGNGAIPAYFATLQGTSP